MNINARMQNYAWFVFLTIYYIQKYLADMKDEFSLDYLIVI